MKHTGSVVFYWQTHGGAIPEPLPRVRLWYWLFPYTSISTKTNHGGSGEALFEQQGYYFQLLVKPMGHVPDRKCHVPQRKYNDIRARSPLFRLFSACASSEELPFNGIIGLPGEYAARPQPNYGKAHGCGVAFTLGHTPQADFLRSGTHQSPYSYVESHGRFTERHMAGP